jgi:hypothetical protein
MPVISKRGRARSTGTRPAQTPLAWGARASAPGSEPPALPPAAPIPSVVSVRYGSRMRGVTVRPKANASALGRRSGDAVGDEARAAAKPRPEDRSPMMMPPDRPAAPVAWALAAVLGATACTGEVRAPLGSLLGSAPLQNPSPTASPSPSSSPTPSPTPTLPPFGPGAPVLRRLVAPQYLGAIEAVLGAEARAAATPPEDAALNGLDALGATQLAASDAAIRAYEASARAVAAKAMEGGAALTRYGACTRGDTDRACFDRFVGAVGRRLLRHTLSADERAPYVALAETAAMRVGAREAGATWALAALLSTPSFVYRAELGEADPSTHGARRLSALELATRLAFFLTDAPPDDTLLDVAERGALHAPAELRAQAERLLATPAARRAAFTFFDERLGLRALPRVPKNAAAFPDFDDVLRRSMRTEVERLLVDVAFDRDVDIRELFAAGHTFVDARLAALYGLEAPLGRGFQRVSLASSPERGGFLGTAAFATLQSHQTTTSPTLRGKFVREVLLCETIQAPPPGVSTVLPEGPGGTTGPRTLREKLEAHLSNPSCAGCHAQIDSIGFGLEKLDPIGRLRALDAGKPIDTRAAFDGQAFDSPRALGRLLASDPRVTRCLTRGLVRQALGRVEAPTEEASVRAIEAAFEAGGYRLQALLVAIATSDAFVRVAEVN